MQNNRNYSSERLFVDHTHTGAKASTKPPIIQTAPLSGGVASDGGSVELWSTTAWSSRSPTAVR